MVKNFTDLTYEKIDPVRFIGNYSSGKMGFALAEECASRGHAKAIPSYRSCNASTDILDDTPSDTISCEGRVNS